MFTGELSMSDFVRKIGLDEMLLPQEMVRLAVDGGVQLTVQTNAPVTVDLYLPRPDYDGKEFRRYVKTGTSGTWERRH